MAHVDKLQNVDRVIFLSAHYFGTQEHATLGSDNQLTDPPDLAARLSFNLFLIVAGIVYKTGTSVSTATRELSTLIRLSSSTEVLNFCHPKSGLNPIQSSTLLLCWPRVLALRSCVLLQFKNRRHLIWWPASSNTFFKVPLQKEFDLI